MMDDLTNMDELTKLFNQAIQNEENRQLRNAMDALAQLTRIGYDAFLAQGFDSACSFEMASNITLMMFEKTLK